MSFDLDEGGGSVLVELHSGSIVQRPSRKGVDFAEAKISFEDALRDVREAASAALRQFRAMASPPDEIEIQFGVKLNTEAGAIIAKTGAEGHLDVAIKWQRKDDGPTSPRPSG
ncbi:CU044_2847 family protein [Microbispora sp. ZYX-F-249]|uniref:CU044_2847 family protein n=1 Tax=Microbispora maris TaxID=3144104 RepID=A0ABV0B3Y6_9ACTN